MLDQALGRKQRQEGTTTKRSDPDWARQLCRDGRKAHSCQQCDPNVHDVLGQTPIVLHAGLLKETEKEEEDYEEIDGTMIGPGGSAVTDDGMVISASKLTVPQLKAELTARGLSTDGKRQDLYRRVQVTKSKTLHVPYTPRPLNSLP